jgi:hypothetical protein
MKSFKRSLRLAPTPNPSIERTSSSVLVVIMAGLAVAVWRATAGGDRVDMDLAVTNASGSVAVAGLFIHGNVVQPELAVRPVKPDGTGRASYQSDKPPWEVDMKRVPLGQRPAAE